MKSVYYLKNLLIDSSASPRWRLISGISKHVLIFFGESLSRLYVAHVICYLQGKIAGRRKRNELNRLGSRRSGYCIDCNLSVRSHTCRCKNLSNISRYKRALKSSKKSTHRWRQNQFFSPRHNNYWLSWIFRCLKVRILVCKFQTTVQCVENWVLRGWKIRALTLQSVVWTQHAAVLCTNST